MAWPKKEEVKVPRLDFEPGEFIRDKVRMSSGDKKVMNILYYDNCILKRGFEYNSDKGCFVLTVIDRKEMSKEAVEAELRLLDIEEEKDDEVKAKLEEENRIFLANLEEEIKEDETPSEVEEFEEEIELD